MDIKDITVRFTETAEEEVALITHELGVLPLVNYLVSSNDDVPEELRGLLVRMIGVVSDLFSTDPPDISKNPEETLRTISRDINLSRVLRERGMFRMFRLLRQRNADNVPVWMSLRNPVTGAPFARQEEFIGWFCEDAHIARSLLFMRVRTIERMLSLNFPLEDIFRLTLSKPYALRETINAVAQWSGGELERVEPQVALQIARRVAPDKLENLEKLAADIDSSPQAREDFHDAAKEVIAELLTEVANHDRAKDAIDFVKHDVLMQPEVTYAWDDDTGVLMVTLVRKKIDPVTGEESLEYPLTVPFVPDVTEVPREIILDLFQRLPIKGKVALDLI